MGGISLQGNGLTAIRLSLSGDGLSEGHGGKGSELVEGKDKESANVARLVFGVILHPEKSDRLETGSHAHTYP